MKYFLRASALSAAFGATLVSGCGGNVNLGSKGVAGSGSGDAGGAPQASTDPDSAPSKPVAMLAKDFSLGTLAVAGDFLYFSGVNAKEAGELYRCRKTDCDATRELLTNVSGAIFSLQVFGDRLGVINYASGSNWIGSYALPGATDQLIAIRDLPGMNPVSALFQEDFVYFSLGIDSGIYRCALPECPNGPERVGLARAAPGQVEVSTDGELVFWTDGKFIYRTGDYGHEPARTLLPDAELSEAPAGTTPPEDHAQDVVEALAAADGFLYAAVRDSEGPGCTVTNQPLQRDPAQPVQADLVCPRSHVRWPASGGPRETLLRTEASVVGLSLLGSELAWIDSSYTPSVQADVRTLSTCRVEACEATRRELGKVIPAGPVADEQDLYWLEAQVVESDANTARSLQLSQIRRAPRLPLP